MTVLKRLSAVYLLVLGVVVAVHLILTQLYDPTTEETARTVWLILDPLMVIAVVIVLITAFGRKRTLSRDANEQISREYLETNFTFYFSAALLLALLWNWVGIQWVEPRNDEGLVWIFIDSTLPFLVGSAGFRLLREA